MTRNRGQFGEQLVLVYPSYNMFDLNSYSSLIPAKSPASAMLETFNMLKNSEHRGTIRNWFKNRGNKKTEPIEAEGVVGYEGSMQPGIGGFATDPVTGSRYRLNPQTKEFDLI